MIVNKNILILSILLFLSLSGKAQFTVTETFKGSALGSNIITGGSAVLTSGNADPVNDGWLRLTPSSGNQKGYAYVNSPFPSTMGVIMEFEYKTWRSSSDSYNGADGFCVFLFDAATPTFATGGYGGSLGYAPNTSAGVTTGLSGGYLGVGFDEYGNFSNGNEGRVGGIGLKCNSITMRGPTTSNATTTNRYLTYTQLQTSASSNANSIDWNTVTTTRPTDATFFRKIKITILPTGTGSYVITVYWQTSTSGSYTQLLQYTTTDVPPANLKLGFAASTGGGFNYHEIRNLYITTLGNVRVQKDVDKANANVGDQVTYTVNVTNDNAAALNGVALADTLKNSAGSFLNLGSDFNINSITFNNNGNSSTTATGFTSGTAKTTGFTNPWNTTLNIAANNAATFTIVGTVLTPPTGNVLKNFVGIDPTPSGIIDQDLTNNYANVSTTVLNPNIDFTVSKTVNSLCADATNGNTYSIVVSNMGASASVNNNTVTVTDAIPAGFTVQSASGTGWTVSNSGNTYTFTRKDKLNSTYSYSPITINVKPPTTGTSWVNTATVAYAGTETNTSNNSSSVTLYNPPAAVSPITGNDFVIVGSSIQLSSTTTGGNWSVSSTAIATINSSGVVTGLQNGSVTVYYTVGTGCTVTVSKIIQVYNKNYWVGGASTDWNTVSNWSDNRIPNVGEDVEFATVAKYGTAAVNDLYVPAGQTKTIGNLTNASTKNLIIPANTTLIVNGVVSVKDPGTGANSTDASKIQIKATPSTSPTTPNGTFIINCTAQSTSGSPDVYVTVDLYAKGKKDTETTWTDNVPGSPTNGTTFSGSYHWQHFGVPVETVKANPTFYGSFLRKYFEDWNGTNTQYYQKWKDLTNESNLIAFEGYEITQDAATTYSIAGKLQYCDKPISLTRSAPAVTSSANTNINNDRYGLGQNIFGNSYTASIDITKLNFPDKVEPTVYLYNTGRFTDWANTTGGGLNTGALSAGQYTSIPQNVASTIYDGRIPSMNGFLLIHRGSSPYYTSTSDTPVTMTLPYANSLLPNTKPQTAPRKPLSYLQINLQSKSTRDNLWLFSEEGTTDRNDDGWDGRKFFGTPTAFIYTENVDGPKQVNADKTIDGSVLSFYANDDTDYTLTLTKSNLEGYTDLQLIDLVTRTATPLTGDVTTYRFTADSKGKVIKRFIIANSAYFDFNSNKFKYLDGYVLNNNRLIISNFTPSDGVMYLYDISGKTLINKKISTSITDIPVSLKTGIYILNLQADGKLETIKLIIK